MKYNVALFITALLTTTTVFLQQAEAQHMIRPPTSPTSPRICDESSFVTLDRAPIGWHHGFNADESVHSFYYRDEPWRFEIGTVFDRIATPDDLYDLASEVLKNIPQDNIFEINGSEIIGELPAIGYYYEYPYGNNTIMGTAVFAIDDQIPLATVDENPTHQTAAFIFTYQADSSVYSRHVLEIQRILKSFSSNNGQC